MLLAGRGAVGDVGIPVAILAGPGGPVLQPRRLLPLSRSAVLRSSPAPEGRCCLAPFAASVARSALLRSSPAPEGRCCSVRW